MRLATSQGGSLGYMPSMRRSSITNVPLPDAHAEPADRHLALEPVAAGLLGARPSAGPRSSVSVDTSTHGDDHADRDGKPPAVAIRRAARRNHGGPACAALDPLPEC